MATVSATPSVVSDSDFAGEIGNVRRDLTIQYNTLVSQVLAFMAAWSGNPVINASAAARGSTDTRVALVNAVNFNINGVPALVAADAVGTAFGALGTIPAATWGLIAVDIIAAGTVTFVSAAANYTTGYTTEALAIAANPAVTANKCRIAYLTILASASTWIAGTDALAGGATGNPATTTNYYNTASLFDSTKWTMKQIGNMAGTAISV